MGERCRLYLITPPCIEDAARFQRELEEALATGEVACLQLRLKSPGERPAPDSQILDMAAQIAPILRRREVHFIINDRPDLVAAAGADGVHVGQRDSSLADARKLLGSEATIGVSCQASRHLALQASEAGADYVAFGAFFPTSTKKASAAASTDILDWWSKATTVPCVAIGGISAENCAPLVKAGADFIAVSSAVWRDPDGPAAAIIKLNAAIAGASADWRE